jgi:hypothetical protein
MGYCVRWDGHFETDKPLSVEHITILRKHDEAEDWPDKTWEPRFRDNPWVLGTDGMSFAVETDKPGDWKPWLQYTLDRFLTPWGYVLSGTVKWDGEEEGDEGVITIEGGRVKARRAAPEKTWEQIPPGQRQAIARGILEAKRDDRRGNDVAWDAAMAALGLRATSDRTVFDE